MGLGLGKRPQEDAVNNRKDCCGAADAEGEGHERDEREARRPPQRPQCVADVLQQHAHGDLNRGDAFFHDATVEEMHAAIGMRGITRIVRDHTDGRPGAMQFAQQVHDRLAVL